VIRAAAVAFACVCALVFVGAAHAATYTVTACSAGGGNGTNNSWSEFAAGPVSVPYTSSCWPNRGLANDINQSVPYLAGDGLTLTAPAGTTLTALSATYQAAWDGGTWGGQVDDTHTALWCPSFSGYACGPYPPAPSWWDTYGPASFSLTGSWQTLRLVGWCPAAGGCQGNLQTAWRDVAVTLTKATAPTLSLTGGGLISNASLSGAQALGWSATDPTGIRRVRLYVDGTLTSDQVEPCDYTYVVPCHAQSGDFVLDTTKLSDGQHTLRVEARDATDANAATQSASFTVSNAGPGQARISPPVTTNGWLSAPQATTYSPQLTVDSGGPAIAGYAVTTDGTTPGGTANVDARGVVAPPPGGWPEGADTIEARAISTSGVASSQVATLVIRVDRTSPSVVVEGYGDPAPAWQPAPVNVRLAAADALSGVGAADDGAPVTAGGYFAYTVDAGPRTTTPGGLATVTLAAQGRHWITFQAYDVAGNVSQSQTVYVNVGNPTAGTPPGSGFWARTDNPNSRFTAAAAFGTNCPAQVTLTPVHDTYVDQSQPDQAYGSAATLVVRSAVDANARSLLDFSLPPAQGCAVTSAVLRLYSTASTGGRTLEAVRAGSPWTDTTVTWTTRPGGTGTPATAVTTANGWQAIDVTSQVADEYGYGDDGLIVRDAAEGAATAAGQSFVSSEGPASEQPQLVLTFG
jgi:hypothetical protein